MSSTRGTAYQAATTIPLCDAWANIKLGTANANEPAVVLDGRGVASVQRVGVGTHGITLSEPQRYGGGGHFYLVTPEYDGITAGLMIPYRSRAGFGSAVSPGNTAEVRILSWKPQYPVIQGGHTLSVNDFPYGKAYINIAAVNFAVDNSMRAEAVRNLLPRSNHYDTGNWVWTNGSADPLTENSNFLPSEIRHLKGTTLWSLTPIPGRCAGSVLVNQSNLTGSRFVPGKNYTASGYFNPGTFASSAAFYVLIGSNGSTYAQTYFEPHTKTLTVTTSGSGSALTGATGWYRDVGDGWYRVWVTAKWAGATTTTRINYHIYGGPTYSTPSDGVKKIYFVANQLEEGNYPTPYIENELSGGGKTGNQDVKLKLAPGSSGYGSSETQYQSVWSATNYQRAAAAYGTIVVPPSHGTTRTAAYIENAYNIKGLSFGNSQFDVEFNTPMNNTDYCIILSAESEPAVTTSIDYGTLDEFSLLAVDRSRKTTDKFRAFSMKQNSADNSYALGIGCSGGGYERINFVVFGERSSIQNGSAWTTNPTLSALTAPASSLDYEVWSSNWYAPDVADTNAVLYPGKTSAARLFRPYASVGFNGNFHPELGITTYAENSTGTITNWINMVNNTPQGRRCFYPLFYANMMPVYIGSGNNTERLVQYYAIRDGYTYTSPAYMNPSGITTSGFTLASEMGSAGSGYTYIGATFGASRRVLGLFADEQTKDVQQSLEHFVGRLYAAGATLDYITDDAENLNDYAAYFLNGGLAKYSTIGGGIQVQGRGMITNQFGYGNGNTLYYDDYGISAAGSCGARVNNYYPEHWMAIANDPRITTYKYSTNGITTDLSPTVNSRFMQIYNDIIAKYAVPGITVTSYLDAVTTLYKRGASVNTTWGGSAGKTFAPYWSTDMGGYQPTTVNEFGKFAIAHAHNSVLYELFHGHYRSIAFKPLLDRGVTLSQYRSGAVSTEDYIYGSDANSFPYPDVSHSNTRAMYSPSFYASAMGDYLNSSHIINKSGYYPNPANGVQRYLYSGYTYPYATGGGFIPNGCKWFYPRTALDGPSGGHFGLTGSTAGTKSGGNTVAAAALAGAVGVCAWGGFTAYAGDLLWFSGVTTPYTVAAGITANAVNSKTITLLDPLVSNISSGQTFEIERPRSNQSYINFIHEIRHMRAILRNNPRIDESGFCPWIAHPQFAKTATDSNKRTFSYWMDERYWWEHIYHLCVMGTQFFNFWGGGGNGFDGKNNDSNAISLHIALDNWRRISGNGRCKPLTKDLVDLSDPITVNGGRLIRGTNQGLHIWRITVRPGLLDETVRLFQTTRNDIPDVLTVPGGIFADHPTSGGTSTGTRGVWLLTRSSVPPRYTIG